METLILKNISKKYKDFDALKDIDLKFQKGVWVSLVGPSGAGKSTFLNVASGLETPTTGKVILNGVEVQDLKEPKRTKQRLHHISYIFQDYKLINYLNVYENVVLTSKLMKKKINKTQVLNILSELGLGHLKTKPVAQLSGGQKQRVAIARAIIADTDVIFADEPTGALDIRTRDQVLNLLETVVKKYHKLLIVITHDPIVAARGDHTLLLMDGAIRKRFEKITERDLARVLVEMEKNYV